MARDVSQNETNPLSGQLGETNNFCKQESVGTDINPQYVDEKSKKNCAKQV